MSAQPPPSPAHKGLRTIAVIEAAKGAFVLAVGFGLLGFLDRDTEALAEQLVRHLHLNPAKHYPHIFIAAMGRLDDSRLLMLAGLALLYATVRFIEAYGLWRERLWAEWFAALSGGIYIPAEIYKLSTGFTFLRLSILVTNLVVVTYLVWVLSESKRKAAAARKAAEMTTLP